jgi:hypothetical protein
MKPKAGWNPRIEVLLQSFEQLRGLLVRGPSGSEALDGSLVGLNPGQLGLCPKAVDSGDWGLFYGGMLYAANVLGKAHELFQSSDSSEGAYWHGMLHRREGDFSNAMYWVHRAGRIPALAELEGFSPAAFIAECAEASARGEEPPHLLEIQRREWEALMFWSWRRLEALR